jgi:RNA polymerase sigma factor (sigma-70 family)
LPDALSSADAARLYERYGFFLLRRCRTLLRDPAAADDALQQVFEQLLRRGGGVLAADEPLRWLYRVVDHCCFDVLRSRRRSKESSQGDGAELGETPHPGVDIEARDAALKLLGTLSDEEMRIAVMLFVDGMSQGEIADEVGLSRVTVNKRIQALRARAAHYIEEAS